MVHQTPNRSQRIIVKVISDQLSRSEMIRARGAHGYSMPYIKAVSGFLFMRTGRSRLQRYTRSIAGRDKTRKSIGYLICNIIV